MKHDEKDYWIRRAMKVYGGSFVSSLSDLLEHADPINYKKLENAFPEYFVEYREMALVLDSCGLLKEKLKK